MRVYHCRICREPGHTRPRCPWRNGQQPDRSAPTARLWPPSVQRGFEEAMAKAERLDWLEAFRTWTVFPIEPKHDVDYWLALTNKRLTA